MTPGDFHAAMRARIVQSEGKYGPIRADDGVDHLRSAMDRIRHYEQDGNTEWLVDAANFLMIEAIHPTHERAHFRATTEKESPGLIMLDGLRQRRLV